MYSLNFKISKKYQIYICQKMSEYSFWLFSFCKFFAHLRIFPLKKLRILPNIWVYKNKKTLNLIFLLDIKIKNKLQQIFDTFFVHLCILTYFFLFYKKVLYKYSPNIPYVCTMSSSSVCWKQDRAQGEPSREGLI